MPTRNESKLLSLLCLYREQAAIYLFCKSKKNTYMSWAFTQRTGYIVTHDKTQSVESGKLTVTETFVTCFSFIFNKQ